MKDKAVFHQRRFALICGLGTLLWGAAWYARQRFHVTAAEMRATRQTQQLVQELTRLQGAVATRPDDVPARYALAQYFLRTGEFPTCEAELKQILRRAPHHRKAWQLLGSTYLLGGRPADAQRVYVKSAQQWPREAWCYVGEASALRLQGRLREAMLAAQHAVVCDPAAIDNEYVLGAVAQEYAAAAPVEGTRTDEYNQARQALEKVVKARPDHPDAELRLGKVYLALKRNDQALAIFEHVLKRDPGSVEALGQLAGTYLSRSNLAKAQVMAERAVAANPKDPRPHDLLGQVLLRSTAPDAINKAVVAFTSAVQLNPSNSRYHERLGSAYLRLNQFQAARQSYEQAARLNPQRAFPLQQLAIIYTRLGQVDVAQKAAKSATALAFNEQQLKHLQTRSIVNPQNIALHFVLADHYLDIGWLTAARDEYQAVLELQPHNQRATTGLLVTQQKAAAGKMP